MMITKTPKDGKGWGQIQIGTTSLVLIFTVLCLVTFSTLSLASAKADMGLALKNQQAVNDFYQGDAQAELTLKKMDSRLGELKTGALTEEAFKRNLKETFKEAYNQDSNRLIYHVEVNRDQFIAVELEPIYDQGGLDEQGTTNRLKNYKIKSWLVKNKVDYEIDDAISVWDGSNLEVE